MPMAAQEKSQIATVISVGKGGMLDGNEIEMQVKVGDRVLFSKFAGTGSHPELPFTPKSVAFS